MFAVILLVTIVMFGCSDTPQITNPATPLIWVRWCNVRNSSIPGRRL